MKNVHVMYLNRALIVVLNSVFIINHSR